MAAVWTAYMPRTVILDSHIALAADGQHYRRIRSADGKILHEGTIERGATSANSPLERAWDRVTMEGSSSSSTDELRSTLEGFGYPVPRIDASIAAGGDEISQCIQWLDDNEESSGGGGASSSSNVDGGDDSKKVCKQCTFANEMDAANCEMCGEDLLQPAGSQESWACSMCVSTDFDAVLECGHKGHYPCLAKYISILDEQGKEPKCLTCDAVLGDAAIRAILGKEAFELRDLRLRDKVGGDFVDCPTPNCTGRYDMSDLPKGMTRTTRCFKCRENVTLKRAEDQLNDIAAAEAAASGAAASGAAGSGAAAAAASGSSNADAINLDSDDEQEKQEKAQDEKTQAVIESLGVKLCPACGQGIEKVKRTCNKVSCRCGCHFCWKCNSLAKKVNGEYKLPCKCTGDEHVFWDNVNGRAEARGVKRRRG